MHYLLQKCLKKCIGVKILYEMHYSDNAFIDNHQTLLIKAICQKYLNVRIHYATKNMCKEESIRNMYTKLILFKGQ